MNGDFGVKFDRVLGTFVPGALMVLGTWYFHRPLLLQRFPSISAEDVGTDTKAIVFLVLAISAGVLIQHIADTAVALLIEDGSTSSKAERRGREVGRAIARIFSFSASPDPRVCSIERYLQSRRRATFLQMAQDWADSSPDALSDNSEKVLVHQHIVAHLKAYSDRSRAVVDESYYEVHFAASFFSAIALLLPIATCALWTSKIANEKFASFSTETYLILIFVVWALGAIAAYAVKRQFRDFCSQALTLALHFYREAGLNDVAERQQAQKRLRELLGPEPRLQASLITAADDAS